MDERHFAAEVESIETFGFVDPVTVRAIPGVAGVEIVDGEHRFKALQALAHVPAERRAAWPDALHRLVDAQAIPAVHLGTIADATAQRLTLVMNETRGHASRADVGRLLAEIEAAVGAGEAMRGLPIDAAELDDLLELAAYATDAHEPNRHADEGEGHAYARHDEGEAEEAPVHRVVALVPDGRLAAVRAAREALEARIAGGEADALPSDPAEAWGETLARLAEAYLDTQA